MVTAEYNIWSLHSRQTSLCINIKPRFPKLFIRLIQIDLDCPCTSTWWFSSVDGSELCSRSKSNVQGWFSYGSVHTDQSQPISWVSDFPRTITICLPCVWNQTQFSAQFERLSCVFSKKGFFCKTAVGLKIGLKTCNDCLVLSSKISQWIRIPIFPQ